MSECAGDIANELTWNDQTSEEMGWEPDSCPTKFDVWSPEKEAGPMMPESSLLAFLAFRCSHGYLTVWLPAFCHASSRASVHSTAAFPGRGARQSLCVGWKNCVKGGVYNVHTFRFGSGCISAGLGRIAYVFWTSQCLQGRECGSSPTSGTADPLVGGDFCFNVCTKLVLMSL